MDVDPPNDNFYDEIASFMPQPGDYSLDDLDEILRSTDSQLDSSIDLNTYVPHYNVSDFEIPIQTQLEHNDYNFSLSAFPSPATTDPSACTPPYDSQRTSSTSSSDGDNFNPDEFINFLNDDDIKIDEFTSDTVMNMMPQRNTPSPTGSCTSSSGSSTSGVHSDASSVASMSQTYAAVAKPFDQDVESGIIFGENSELNVATDIQTEDVFMPATPSVTTIPINLPVQVTTAMAIQKTTVLKSVQPVIPTVNLLQGTIIPVKTVPLTTVTTGVNIRAPATLKIEPKLKLNSVNAQPIKIVTSSVTTNNVPAGNTGKITPPANAKPKTIFLSSNDFKALMQKMNTNGKGGAKITGGMNGQIPKIVMKTASGKVITTNKVVPATVTNQTISPTQIAPQFVPKIVKATGPLVIKQHQQQATKYTPLSTNLAAVAAAARRASLGSSSVSSTHSAPDHNIYKGLVDEKMYKKQQRMIKNRESASLSRRKKKEYVVSLESRINNLEKENYTLKGENTSLRSQLVAYAQTCQCKHSNISEFILNSLSANGKGEHPHHVKIAPKPAPRSLKQRMTAANVKKNVAVLFAMAFMVTLNVGNFQTYFDKNSIENSVEPIAPEEPIAMSAGRRLLWVENESEFNEKLNRSNRSAETELLEVPPLHFLRPTGNNRTGNGTMHEPPLPSKCGGSPSANTNQTENQRLASNLKKWIGGNDYLNLSMHETNKRFGKNDLNDPQVLFKLTPDYFELKSIDLPLQAPGPTNKEKRKLFIQRPHPYNGNNDDDDNTKQRKLDNEHDNTHNSLKLFKPKISDEYLRLFKGIKRQDDTFYVLSFNMDHILLPASAYNKSSRPKMSLMLPAGDPSLNGDIVLMQIDCEVVNTTELELKSDMIPEKLRPQKYGTAEPHPNDVANNETGAHQQAKSRAEKIPLKAEDHTTKERHAAPRTYFMMGPKTQAAAAAALKKKPLNIVKLSGNESVANIAQFNMKNSTLFAKMRETVEGDFAP